MNPQPCRSVPDPTDGGGRKSSGKVEDEIFGDAVVDWVQVRLEGLVSTLVEIWAGDGDSKGARYYVAMSRYTEAYRTE